MSNYYVLVKMSGKAIGPLESYKVADAYKQFIESFNKEAKLSIVVEVGDTTYPFLNEPEVHGD